MIARIYRKFLFGQYLDPPPPNSGVGLGLQTDFEFRGLHFILDALCYRTSSSSA